MGCLFMSIVSKKKFTYNNYVYLFCKENHRHILTNNNIAVEAVTENIKSASKESKGRTMEEHMILSPEHLGSLDTIIRLPNENYFEYSPYLHLANW